MRAVSGRRRAVRASPALQAQGDFLLALVEQTPDMTIIEIIEMQERLATEGGIKASVGTIWTLSRSLRPDVQKSPRTRQSGAGTAKMPPGRMQAPIC
jgi:hypothetical protein